MPVPGGPGADQNGVLALRSRVVGQDVVTPSKREDRARLSRCIEHRHGMTLDVERQIYPERRNQGFGPGTGRGNHDIGGNRLAGLEPDSRHPAASCFDLADPGLLADGCPARSRRVHESVGGLIWVGIAVGRLPDPDRDIVHNEIWRPRREIFRGDDEDLAPLLVMNSPRRRRPHLRVLLAGAPQHADLVKDGGPVAYRRQPLEPRTAALREPRKLRLRVEQMADRGRLSGRSRGRVILLNQGDADARVGQMKRGRGPGDAGTDNDDIASHDIARCDTIPLIRTRNRPARPLSRRVPGSGPRARYGPGAARRSGGRFPVRGGCSAPRSAG